MSLKISIIIVSYNTKDILKDSIASIINQTVNISYEIIVFDNGSSDGSQAMVRHDFPGVVLIENRENIGFGAANNRAHSIVRGEYVFFLNSDTVLLNNAVKNLF